MTELVKDSTDDLWFLESTTDDDDDEGDKQLSDGNVYVNELDVVSEAGNEDRTDSENDSILPDEVSSAVVMLTSLLPITRRTFFT